MKALKVSNSDLISTIVLRDTINTLRADQGENPIRNDQFIARVEDELGGAIEGAKLLHLAPRTKTPMDAYNLTRDQCLLVGMRESKAVRAKVLEWLKMLEQNLLIEDKRKADRQAARLEAPQMCSARANARMLEGKEIKSHLFSNEYNMINKIVLGCTSKDYAKEHGLKPTDPIRDIMRPVEIEAISGLQNANTNFIDAGMEYQERKAMLKSLFDRKYKAAIIEEIIRIES